MNRLRQCIIDSMDVPSANQEGSLYRRIGGYDVIPAVIDDLFALMRADSGSSGLARDEASIHAGGLSS